MKTISFQNVRDIMKAMADPATSNENFFYGALLSYNEFALSVATRLPEGDPLRDEMLAFAQRSIPARFSAYLTENWNGIASDPTAQTLAKLSQ